MANGFAKEASLNLRSTDTNLISSHLPTEINEFMKTLQKQKVKKGITGNQISIRKI